MAIIAAFAMALEYLPHSINAIQVNYGLIPVTVLALRRGTKPALAAGLVWGLLDLLLRGLSDGGVLNVVQGILEYPIAFTVVGFAGLVAPAFQSALHAGHKNRAVALAWASVLIGTFIKYFCHFLAGWVYWGSYAPKGQAAWLYSLISNGSSAVGSSILAIVVVSALVLIAQHLFVPKPTQSLRQA
ncbi:proton-coupled thiamine transporter [Lacticaseibacillus nasuensis JCM 17158]|uniref:Proton-coupled thiamine transporter n=1 Tax=Lacticaseibacillus nasuensis JCM 17158 TaxID=1291734 RepID=A0A0R1JXY5_9LACO|nr:proton-coupled thiamine transporter [Lacticaseibacillus nasuensis JCM 17158]